MKRFGIVSYNIHCNFTNYGSALQSWALQQVIDRLGNGQWRSVLVDYCPDALLDKDPRDPIRHMWDTDEESRRMCVLSMPAILKNADRFDQFYKTRFLRTIQTYTSENFHEIIRKERLDGFICGSDTIFCIDEFGGFDDGYYAEYPCMKHHAAAYAASFGDAKFTPESYAVLERRLKNFVAIGLRENAMIPYVTAHSHVPVQQVLDPTLLLTADDYRPITAERLEEQPYLLLYARRYHPDMFAYAEALAKEQGWKIIEISLRATNKDKHRMFYEAGVEEFLSLVKHAEFVVTNSYHGMIFSIQFHRGFRVFSREQCDTKIKDLLARLNLSPYLGAEGKSLDFDGQRVQRTLKKLRERALFFLKEELIALANCEAQEVEF